MKQSNSLGPTGPPKLYMLGYISLLHKRNSQTDVIYVFSTWLHADNRHVSSGLISWTGIALKPNGWYFHPRAINVWYVTLRFWQIKLEGKSIMLIDLVYLYLRQTKVHFA